jgi:hypothetical protein
MMGLPYQQPQGLNPGGDSMTPTFKWTCSYQGTIWYQVTDHTGTYEAQFRRCAEQYECEGYNGDAARDLVAAIGIFCRSHSLPNSNERLFEVPQSTVDAFNAWRIAERARHVAEIKSQPHRYREVDESDPLLFPPILSARQGYYVIGEGWRS